MKTLPFALIGAALLLGGCAERAVSTPSAPPQTAAAPAPATPQPAPEPDRDLCQASTLQSFVGQPRASLPPVPEGVTRREVCETCAMTMDFRIDRQTVVYETSSSLIKSIQCV